MPGKSHRRAVVGLALGAALLALPATAGAATGPPVPVQVFGTITVSIGSSAPLYARLLVWVPVDLVCKTNKLAPSKTPDNTFVSVNIEEAVGNSIANGSGAAGRFACDGKKHHILVPVEANPCCPAPPFRGGQAIVNAFVQADWGPFDPNSGSPAGSAFGSAGPQVIRLVVHT
jgi:hypothetical protein